MAGIEPASSELQSDARTNSATFPKDLLTEAKRIELLTGFNRRRFRDAFLVHAGQPPGLARTDLS